MKFWIYLFYCVMFFLNFSCNDSLHGDLINNQNPETYTVVDTIIRYGTDRFTTKVVVSWWGDDKDGFITGYEISFDNNIWFYTKNQDSTFLLRIPEGSDTFDFSFYIRSIDNNGMKDPTPAIISYPVKNSAPQVEFIYPSATPVRKPFTSFPVLKFDWIGNDPDGKENIDHYEIYLNDTNNAPLIVSGIYSSLYLKAVNSKADQSECYLFLGSNLTKNDVNLEGLQLDDTNQLFIKAVDLVGEKSTFAASYKIYLRKQTSDILLVNAYNLNIQEREDFYKNNLNLIGITNYQLIRINEVKENRYTELAPDNISQSMIFSLFKTIIWFGKDVSYSLSLAQRTTDEFFNTGGKLFLAVEISTSIEDQAGYLDFTPIDSLVSIPAGYKGFLIDKADIRAKENGWP